jgi:hypothetical protein
MTNAATHRTVLQFRRRAAAGRSLTAFPLIDSSVDVCHGRGVEDFRPQKKPTILPDYV